MTTTTAPRHLQLALTALAGCFAGGCATSVTIGDPQPPMPQRPTISSDTGTIAPGNLETEAGGVVDFGDSLDTPVTMKYGAGESTEAFVGWSPYRWVELPGEDEDGIGDVLLGARHRFVDEDETFPSLAFQVATKLPAGNRAPGLSSGELDFFAAAIATKSFEQVAVTGFYQMGLLGDPAAPDTDLQHVLALAAARPIPEVDENLYGFGELATILEPESDVEQLLLTGGAGYVVGHGLALDVGMTFGLSDESPDFQLLFGLTKNWGAVEIDPPRRRR